MSGIISQPEVTHLIDTIHTPYVTETLFREDALFALPGAGLGEEYTPGEKLRGLFSYEPSRGGYQEDTPVLYASDAAVEMDGETDPAPSPGSSSETTASWSPRYFQTTMKIWEQTLDGLTNDAQVIDVLDLKMYDRKRALRSIINTTMAGAGSTNLQAAVDSTTSYAGISDRATYGWASAEEAVDGAIALSDLEDLVETLELRGVPLNELVWVMRSNQITNIGNLAGWSGNSVVQKMVVPGGAFDPSFIRQDISICGIPIYPLTSLTSDVILLLHYPSLKWKMHAALKMSPLAKVDYGYSWLMTVGVIPKVEKPHWCGKLTGVTA
jgi:hypothetical protein